MRPDDGRYLSLPELYSAVRARAEQATARTTETRTIRVEADRGNAESLTFAVPGRDAPIASIHWSFGQLYSLVGAHSGYLRELPAALAGINLQHGLLTHRVELVKTLEIEDDRIELRAVTGPDYGRIWDHELVAAVMRIAGNGTGDTNWTMPGSRSLGSSLPKRQTQSATLSRGSPRQVGAAEEIRHIFHRLKNRLNRDGSEREIL